jgi:hypothetical protein
MRLPVLPITRLGIGLPPCRYEVRMAMDNFQILCIVFGVAFVLIVVLRRCRRSS